MFESNQQTLLCVPLSAAAAAIERAKKVQERIFQPCGRYCGRDARRRGPVRGRGTPGAVAAPPAAAASARGRRAAVG